MCVWGAIEVSALVCGEWSGEYVWCVLWRRVHMGGVWVGQEIGASGGWLCVLMGGGGVRVGEGGRKKVSRRCEA